MFASTSKMFSSSASKPSSKQGSKHSSTTPLIPAGKYLGQTFCLLDIFLDLEDMYDEDDGLPEVIYVIPMRITGFLLLAFGIAEVRLLCWILAFLILPIVGDWSKDL